MSQRAKVEKMQELSIYSWNVNGFNAITQKEFFQKFMKEAQPDIIVLQEIKMQKKNVLKYSNCIPEEYSQFWNCASKKAGYSGTAIFTKLQPIEVKSDIGIMKHDGFGRVQTAEFQ